MERYLPLILFLIALWIFLSILLTHCLKGMRKRSFLIRRAGPRPVDKVLRILDRHKGFNKLLDWFAIRIGIFNSYSFKKNREYGLWAILCCLITFAIVMLWPGFYRGHIWYERLAGFLVMVGIIALILYLINSLVLLSFTCKLPMVFKLLTSRYMTEGDILKAIDRSIDDLKGSMLREMLRVQQVLRKNQRDKIEATFRAMEDMYQNEYFTLLLSLIHQAYFKGGQGGIKQQFENITEEIYTAIENEKDLIVTSRMYIFLSLLLPLGIYWIERFNEAALAEKSLVYYQSLEGGGLRILLWISMITFIGIMIFMEKVD